MLNVKNLLPNRGSPRFSPVLFPRSFSFVPYIQVCKPYYRDNNKKTSVGLVPLWWEGETPSVCMEDGSGGMPTRQQEPLRRDRTSWHLGLELLTSKK